MMIPEHHCLLEIFIAQPPKCRIEYLQRRDRTPQVFVLRKIVKDACGQTDDLLPFCSMSKTMLVTATIYHGVHRDLTVKLNVKSREIDEDVVGTAFGSN